MDAETVINVMADYGCYPLWVRRPGSVADNVDPGDLQIPADLVQELRAWAASFDQTLNNDDPMASGFVDLLSENDFIATGAALAERLSAAIPEVIVEYTESATGTVRLVSTRQ